MMRVMGFLFALAGAAALALLAFTSLRIGYAELRAMDARALASGWKGRPQVASTEAWNRARARLIEARALDARNPSYPEELAWLYDYRTLAMPRANALAAAYLRQALEYLRAAAPMRPGSPYNWASIALVKSKLAEYDAEFERAYGNAARLGPWTPEVRAVLAETRRR